LKPFIISCSGYLIGNKYSEKDFAFVLELTRG